MSKICRFSTSIFSRLGLDLGGFWASKMEPSWLLRPQKIFAIALLKRLKLSVLKKWRLGGLQGRIWKPQGSILEGLGTIFAIFSYVLSHVVHRSNPSRNPSSNASSDPCQWTPRVAKNGQESPSAKYAKNAKNAKSQESFP